MTKREELHLIMRRERESHKGDFKRTQRMIRKDDKGEKGKEKCKEKILTQKIMKSLGIG